MKEKTESQKSVDKAIDMILKASGSSITNYTMPSTLENMRREMLSIMQSAYVQGALDHAGKNDAI